MRRAHCLVWISLKMLMLERPETELLGVYFQSISRPNGGCSGIQSHFWIDLSAGQVAEMQDCMSMLQGRRGPRRC